MQKVIYETETGDIREFAHTSLRLGGLNPALGIGESAGATGKEHNISEIPDLVDVTDDCAVRKGEEESGMSTREQLSMRKLAKAQTKGKTL